MAANAVAGAGSREVNLTLEPLKSIAVVFGTCDEPLAAPVLCTGEAIELKAWKRSTCEGVQYPNFGNAVSVSLPDNIAEEQPEFSGYARYETSIQISESRSAVLEITDVAEGVEVFVNGRSLGIQVVPPFRYDLTDAINEGENPLVIEVAATLERKCYPLLKGYRKMITPPPSGKTGLTGTVHMYRH